MKIVLASQHKRQPNKSLSRFVDIENTDSKSFPHIMQMSYSYTSELPCKNFCKLAKEAKAIRNSAKRVIHSNREIKEIFDPEKLTFSINSGHKSA